jgi:hypothetical protein
VAVDLSKHSTATGLRGSFDDKKLTKIEKGLIEFTAYETQVGYYTGATYPDGTMVSAVAAFHEFGTANMPQRSFLRSTLSERSKEIEAVTAEASADVLAGKDPKQAASKIARTIGGLVYQKLVNGPWSAEQALADSTIAAKGHDTILYDTGVLRERLMWRVTKNGRIVAQGHAKNVRTA